jgi:hypothetical protein
LNIRGKCRCCAETDNQGTNQFWHCSAFINHWRIQV